MKNQIKRIFSQLLNWGGWLIFNLCGVFYNKKNKALVLVPSWEGSLGDEAVLESIASTLRSKGFVPYLLHYGRKEEWDSLTGFDGKVQIARYYDGRPWLERGRLMFILPRFESFYLMGTDMLDGCYAEWLTLGLLQLAEQAAIAGLNTTLVGFSINSWQRPSCIKFLQKFPPRARLCVRDGVSKRRLEGLTGRKDLILTADMAFMLQPELNGPVSKKIINWVKDQQKQEKVVIGLNINPQLFDKFSQEEINEVPTRFAEMIKILSQNLNSKISFLLLPHDFREYNSDVVLLNKVLESLPGHLAEQVEMIREKPRAAEIKGIISSLDTVITGRMHVAIASLGSAIPLGCFVYQGKFEGLFEHLNAPEKWYSDPGILLKPADCAEFVSQIISNRVHNHKLINKQLPKIKELSVKNLGLGN